MARSHYFDYSGQTDWRGALPFLLYTIAIIIVVGYTILAYLQYQEHTLSWRNEALYDQLRVAAWTTFATGMVTSAIIAAFGRAISVLEGLLEHLEFQTAYLRRQDNRSPDRMT